MKCSNTTIQTYSATDFNCMCFFLSHTHTRTHTHAISLSETHTQISFALWLPIEVSVSLCFSHFSVVPPTCTTCLIVLKIQKSEFVSSYKTEDSFWTYKVFNSETVPTHRKNFSKCFCHTTRETLASENNWLYILIAQLVSMLNLVGQCNVPV